MTAQVQQSYNHGTAITTSDTVNFDKSVSATGASVLPCDAIWVGAAGTVTVVWQDGQTTQFTCATGTILPVSVIRVNATGTAASLLVALYLI